MTRLIQGRQFKGDRALLWLGNSKLVFVSLPVPHADYLRQHFGYQDTRYLHPISPSPCLCLDILREPDLIHRLVEYTGPQRTVQLIPYATTPEFLRLAKALETEYELTVLLPESPSLEAMWVRDYIDTKSGFRLLASEWLSGSALPPSGYIAQDLQQAAAVAHWYAANGQACITKANGGENGIGHCIVRPGDFRSAAEINAHLASISFLHDDLITVEAFVRSIQVLSPSLELYVPPPGAGEPEITYLSSQVFADFGAACGVLVSRDLVAAPWYPSLAESGMVIATKLQSMGYAGHFDLDAIVDDDEQIYLLEVNARRTGGTHVHEFACFFFGADYLDRVALINHDSMSSGAIRQYDELMDLVGDLLYPIDCEQRGVVVSVTSSLVGGKFGCIVVGSSTEDALTLHQVLKDRFMGEKE